MLKIYSDRYWELFNQIDEDFEDMVVRTFKVGLLMNHDLRKSLTMKPTRNMHQLMDHIDEHKKVEENQVQGKGKVKVFTPKRMNPRPDNYDLNRPRRDFFNQPLQVNTSAVSLMLKDLVYQILKKIKNESYFKWPNKMGGYPIKRESKSVLPKSSRLEAYSQGLQNLARLSKSVNLGGEAEEIHVSILQAKKLGQAGIPQRNYSMPTIGSYQRSFLSHQISRQGPPLELCLSRHNQSLKSRIEGPRGLRQSRSWSQASQMMIKWGPLNPTLMHQQLPSELEGLT